MPRKPTNADTKPLKVTERPTASTADVHPGWVLATRILLKGLQRLRDAEAQEKDRRQ